MKVIRPVLKIKSDFAAVDWNKCLKLAKLPILFDTCANISKIPSNISTSFVDYKGWAIVDKLEIKYQSFISLFCLISFNN